MYRIGVGYVLLIQGADFQVFIYFYHLPVHIGTIIYGILQVRMVRENNMKVFAPQAAAEEPKFGAGSAFGKDQKVGVSVADPESGAFLTPGSGMGKKSGSGSGMNNPDKIYEILETIYWFNIP